MRCAICEIAVETIDEAVTGGWTPYFYDGRTEHEVACPACTKALLQEGKDGEMEVKEQYRGRVVLPKETEENAQGGHLMIGVAVLEREPKDH